MLVGCEEENDELVEAGETSLSLLPLLLLLLLLRLILALAPTPTSVSPSSLKTSTPAVQSEIPLLDSEVPSPAPAFNNSKSNELVLGSSSGVGVGQAGKKDVSRGVGGIGQDSKEEVEEASEERRRWVWM